MRKIFLIVILLFCAAATAAGYASWALFWARPADNAPIIQVEVKIGDTAGALGQTLRDRGVVRSAWLFKWYLKKKGLDKNIPAGWFDFKTGMSIRAAVLFLSDSSAGAVKLLFREGQTMRDYNLILQSAGLNAAFDKDLAAEFDFLRGNPIESGLEGYLFPDTYFFYKNDGAEAVLRRMLENFGRKLTPELRAEIARQKKTIHEVVTMASLLEAEARSDGERRLAADVLWRRLAIGMGLQLDSTVNYITGRNKPAISLAEKEIDSLYNTYKYRGLPPGPINNPGMSAILAAIYPEKNDYWFFLADKEGKVHFAKTLDEHNELKYKYLKK